MNEAQAQRLHDKLRLGVLPTSGPLKVSTTFGSGLLCDACDEPITTQETDHPNRVCWRHVHFHRGCVQLWKLFCKEFVKETYPRVISRCYPAAARLRPWGARFCQQIRRAPRGNSAPARPAVFR